MNAVIFVPWNYVIHAQIIELLVGFNEKRLWYRSSRIRRERNLLLHWAVSPTAPFFPLKSIINLRNSRSLLVFSGLVHKMLNERAH